MIPEPTQNELNIAGRIYTAGARDLAALMDTTDFQRGKATILLVTHRPSHLSLADQIVILDKGAVRAAGPAAEIRAKLA